LVTGSSTRPRRRGRMPPRKYREWAFRHPFRTKAHSVPGGIHSYEHSDCSDTFGGAVPVFPAHHSGTGFDDEGKPGVGPPITTGLVGQRPTPLPCKLPTLSHGVGVFACALVLLLHGAALSGWGFAGAVPVARGPLPTGVGRFRPPFSAACVRRRSACSRWRRSG